MNAKALVCDEAQHFTLEDVTLKEPGPDQIAIRTVYSGVSIGTEFALVRNKVSWGPYPICTGYQGTGVVETVGADIDNFKTGDRVYFRGNENMTLADGTTVSAVSGTHCSRIVISPNTTHGADHMPDGAPMDVASMFVMPAVGLFGVDMSNPKMGQVVAVYGVGLIGLGVVAACSARGCVVVAVDINDRQLALAREMGADYLINGSTEDAEEALKRIAPDGADVVFEATGIPACIKSAIELCRDDGSFIWQGNYGEAAFPFEFMPAHGRRLRMFFPCDDGWQPCRRAVVKNMTSGVLPWEKCITHRVDAEDAPELFENINTGADKSIVGAVIRWSDEGGAA